MDSETASKNSAAGRAPASQEDLEKQLEEMKLILGHAKILTARYYVEGKKLIFSPEAAEAFGADEVYYNFPESYLVQGKVVNNVDQFVEFYEDVCRGIPAGKANAEIKMKNGEIRLFNRQYTTIFDADKKPLYATISLMDITEQREQKVAYEKWKYSNKSQKQDSLYYYDYNLTRDVLEAAGGNRPLICPPKNEVSFPRFAKYVAENIIHPEDREEYLRVFSRPEMIRKFQQNITEITTEHRRLLPDGTYIHARGIIQLFTDPFNGDVLCFILIKNQDEAKERMKSILKEEAFDMINQSMPGGLLCVYNKPDFPLHSVNEGMLHYLGYTNEEVMEKGSVLALTHPDDREKLEESMRKAIRGSKEFELSHRVLKKDGSIGWMIHRGRINQDMDGNEIWIGACIDISESVKLQEELKEKARALEEKNAELAALTDNVPGGVSIMRLDRCLTLLYANQAFYEMHGYTPEQVRRQHGNRWMNTVHPKDMEMVERKIFGAYKRKDSHIYFETRVVKGGGGYIWVMVRGTFIQEKDEVHIHGVTLDITDRKEYEEERKKQEKALQRVAEAAAESARMKSAFLANMSHEIRTPMNGVIGFAELALDDSGIPGKTRSYLEKIKLSASGLLDIINDILDISKIEAGKMEVEEVDFCLHDIFKQCETVSGIKAKEKGILLYFYAEPYIGRLLKGDPTKLRQILLNLLSNAIKFTNKGIVKLSAIAEERENEEIDIYFEVKDSGIGMTREQIKVIFEPFSQADTSTTRKYGGTGLGLSITQSMLAMLGGKLEVESAPGLGSKFSFKLRFKLVDEREDKDLEKAAKTDVKRPTFEGEVLICEDNSINQQVIGEHLQRLGLKTVIAANGRRGIELVRQRKLLNEPFDLILMDIHMPVMDGLEATERILGMGVETPIIALTANAMVKDKELYLSKGMKDYIAKPFNAKQLWSCLIEYLTPVSQQEEQEKILPPKEPALEAMILNRSLGIERAAGNEELYRSLQREFVKQNAHKYKELKSLISRGDIKNAHRRIHTLKSVAGTLGAVRLSQAAARIEAVMRVKRTVPALPDMEALERELTLLLAELKRQTQALPDAQERREPMTDGQAALHFLNGLTALLREGDAECVEYLEMAGEILQAAGEAGVLLEEQIRNYDFEQALLTAEEISKTLKLD